jgi:hypothetical protein
MRNNKQKIQEDRTHKIDSKTYKTRKRTQNNN